MGWIPGQDNPSKWERISLEESTYKTKSEFMKGLRLLFYLQANKLACHTFIYVYHDICFYINIYQSNRPIYIYVTICIYIHIKK